MKTNKSSKSIFTLLAIIFIFNTFISVEAVDYKKEKDQQASAGNDSSQPKIDDDQLVADNFGPGPGVWTRKSCKSLIKKCSIKGNNLSMSVPWLIEDLHNFFFQSLNI